MTGVEEVHTVRVVSPVPAMVRVSVLGRGTQLDIALPADLPIAAFVPELARLVSSRDTPRTDDDADRDEARTFWILSRDEGGAIRPDQTLRDVGVESGQLLRLSAERSLSPPTLYDDVVDAAARLNRAAYAAWNATSAAALAFVGLWVCAAAWVYFLLADALSEHRGVIVGGAVLTTVALVAGGALAHRALGRKDVAVAAGWPAIAISAALCLTLLARFGDYGWAVACGLLVALVAFYHRLIGTGHAAYIASAVIFGVGALGFVARGAGVRVEIPAVAAAIVGVLGCLAVPALTSRLGRFPAPPAPADTSSDNPFTARVEAEEAQTIPTAEEVWSRVHTAALTRAGLLAGCASVTTVAAVTSMRAHPGWPALVFALTCAVVLALRSRHTHAISESVCLAVPATVLTVISCLRAGTGALGIGGIGVLAAVGVVATLVAVRGITRLSARASTVAAYGEYVAVATLIPTALWVIGVYQRW